MENESKKSGIYVSKGLLIFIIIAFIVCIGIIVYQNFIKVNTISEEKEIKPMIENKNNSQGLNSESLENIENNRNIVNSEKVNENKIKQKEEIVYNASYSTKVNDEFGTRIYNIPFINIDSEYVKELNNKIERKFKNIVSNMQEPFKVDYQYYINDNVLSLVIISNYSNDVKEHEVYNIDINNGTEINDVDLLKRNNINGDEFLVMTTKTCKKAFIDMYGTKEKASGEILEYYDECYGKTIDNNMGARSFINSDGEIYIVAKIYSFAGADYYEHILKLIK